MIFMDEIEPENGGILLDIDDMMFLGDVLKEYTKQVAHLRKDYIRIE